MKSSILKILSLLAIAPLLHAFFAALQCHNRHSCRSLTATTATSMTKTANHGHAVNATIVKLDANASPPNVAWLLSFPNSGTSFTMQLVRRLSKMSTATNYGIEMLSATTGKSMPLYTTEDGPFWADPQMLGTDYTRPTDFVLTKTHCCGPLQYQDIKDTGSFLTQCLSGKSAHRNKTSGRVVKTITAPYSRDVVKKAVHLIRSPFDNVVSRFHLKMHEAAKRNDTEKVAKYPYSREGFRKYCLDRNARYEKRESRSYSPKVFALLDGIPCRQEFYRFVRWHNLAHRATQVLSVPTMVLHYEDYQTNFNETVATLLEFLHLESKGDPMIQFVAGKTYEDYYSLEEHAKVKKAMKSLALVSTWKQISRYFIDADTLGAALS